MARQLRVRHVLRLLTFGCIVLLGAATKTATADCASQESSVLEVPGFVAIVEGTETCRVLLPEWGIDYASERRYIGVHGAAGSLDLYTLRTAATYEHGERSTEVDERRGGARTTTAGFGAFADVGTHEERSATDGCSLYLVINLGVDVGGSGFGREQPVPQSIPCHGPHRVDVLLLP